MVRLGVPSLLSCLLLACGGDRPRTRIETATPTGEGAGEPPAQPTSGSRLKAIWQKSADGPAAFVHWYDTRLETECDPHRIFPASACLPARMITLDPQGIYVDPECKQRLVHRGAVLEAETSFAAVWLGEFRCDVRLQVFRAGDPEPSGSRYARLGSGGCQKVAEPETHLGATPMLRLREITGDLAAITIRRGTTKQGLAPLIMESEDGARALWGWWNAARGEPCAYEQALGNDSLRLHGGSDGTLRCRPIGGRVPEETPGACTSTACPWTTDARQVPLPSPSCLVGAQVVGPADPLSCPAVAAAWTSRILPRSRCHRA